MIDATATLLTRFEDRLHRVQAGYGEVDAAGAAAAIEDLLSAEGVTKWLASPGFPAPWLPPGATPAEEYLSLAQIAGAARLGCLEMGLLGIAETGSVLTTGHPAGRRLAMLSDVQILVVRTEDVVPTLDEAAAFVARCQPPMAHLSFVTGASRSSDIERTLAIGVHGPAVVQVLAVRGRETGA